MRRRSQEVERQLLAGYEEGRYGLEDIVRYALTTVGGRWLEAEPVILEMGSDAVDYSLQVLKGRWEEAEPSIMCSSHTAAWYAIRVLQRRWPAAESAIMESPIVAVEYARDVIHGRWPEAEQVILQGGPACAVRYAQAVLGERWLEAEPTIMQSATEAVTYAKSVIKGRWLEAEPMIALRDEVDLMYLLIDENAAERYAQEVLPGHWDEEVALKCSCWLYYYAKDVIGGRLPDKLHNRMLMFGMENPKDPWVQKYLGAKKYQRVREPR